MGPRSPSPTRAPRIETTEACTAGTDRTALYRLLLIQLRTLELAHGQQRIANEPEP